MPLILPRRGILSYPAGRAPGVDPGHVASKNCVFSGIATNGGSFCNVLSQAKPTENGTKTTSLNGGLGPVTNYVNNGAATDSSVFSAVTSATSVTLAVIFKMTAIPPATGYLINTAQAGGNGIGDNGGTGIFSIIGGSVATNTGITYVLGAPYFFVASWSGASMSWVVTRLDTGQVVSGTAADTIVAPDGTISVGNRGTAARNANGGIAAAMATNAFMGEQQLRAWAADPWSFWYPNKPLNLTSTAATASTATGGARVSQRFNRSKLAYPAGVLPGFDPGHVAAQNLVFSCAPTGPAGLINLPTGKALTSLGGSVNPTYGVDGAIGPSLTMPASSKGLGATVSLTTRGWTMATIFDYTTVTGASQVLISTNSTTSPSMWLTPGGLLNYAGSTSIFSYNFILGHSYFVVTSRPFNSVDSNLYILVKDLTTGQTYQGIFTTGVDIPQAVTSYTIAAGDSGSFNLGCPIAAAMAANQYMNAPQLLAWSKDPWAFWYPNKTINLTSDAAAVVTPPSGTFNYTNFLLMGVG